MLPFTCLTTRPFFPHTVRVIKTFRMISIRFQGKVFFRFYVLKVGKKAQTHEISREFRMNVHVITWIIILKLALRSPNNHIFASPCKFLNEWTKIGQCNRATVVFFFSLFHIIDEIEILIHFWQWILMPN